MLPKATQILLVDDEIKLVDSIAQRLKLMGFVPLTATDGAAAMEIAKENPVDLAIVDLQMPDMDGLVTITKLKEIRPSLKTILLTGHGSDKIKQATESLNTLYFEKDEIGDLWRFIKKLNTDGNEVVIRPATASHRPPGGQEAFPVVYPADETEMISGRDTGNIGYRSGRFVNEVNRPRIVGETPAMRELRKKIERVAALDCTVILRGETGTGKELTARVIHAMSIRRNHRFLAINCGSFGNEALIGQFLGNKNSDLSEAIRIRSGIFGSEMGGTILFDQVEDMPQQMQIQLLKIIDATEMSRTHKTMGEQRDIRILAATDADLMERVKAGTFRKDLYYRLNLFELSIPPLRERKDDIPPLCSYFLDKYRKEFQKPVESISQQVMDIFTAYDFPGNVRELEHIIERAVILADGSVIEMKHLPGRLRNKSMASEPVESRKFRTLAQMETQYIQEVLAATGGNKSKTAHILGISRAALWRKLKQLKEKKPDPSSG